MTESHDRTGAALAGIRVLELAQNIAGPSCGRVLAAMGAEVIKVEPPGGDATRHMAPFPGLREGRAYLVANPGKRSVVLALDDPASHEVRDALLRSVDVVLCAFKGADLERYGVDYERVRSINPSVIYLEHRAFGSEGPDRDEGGYDVLVQGVSGLSWMGSRTEDGRPITLRPAYSDFATGLASAAAILGALFHRQRTGEGQRVHTSLLNTALFMGAPIVSRYGEHDREQVDAFHEDLALMRSAGATFEEQRDLYESRVLPAGGAYDYCFRHYSTADGMISVGCLSPALMDRFAAVTGLPDPRKEKWTYRGPEWMAFVAQCEALLRSDTSDAWISRLRAGGVPASRYYAPTEALQDPGAIANGMAERLVHPVIGEYVTVAAPLRMDGTPTITDRPSPALGADTDAVLRELGYDDAAIASLHERGVTRPR